MFKNGLCYVYLYFICFSKLYSKFKVNDVEKYNFIIKMMVRLEIE